ncbi:MAG TPA: 50S ribosomal protein L24 [Candidatus Paceibacterota bacterium]|nr:50S ribosomal protein L24 [Candidatus Paceibacterota bacterium]
MKIKKGDNVIMLSGKDRGKTGSVVRTDPTSNRLTIQGLNMIKRHLRARRGGQKGQIVSVERWVSASAVAFVSKETGKATRLGWLVNADGTKTRIDRKTNLPV